MHNTLLQDDTTAMPFSRLLPFALLLEALVVLAAYMESQGALAPFFQAAARLSARVSLLVFGVLIVYATLNPAFDRLSSVFQNKYRLYRDFAIVHLIHWCFLAVAVSLTGFELQATRVAGGVLAYLCVVSMPFLMKNQSVSQGVLSRMQAFYLFWVWLIFFLTYVTRLRGQTSIHTGSPATWKVGLASAGALMLWRIVYIGLYRRKAGEASV